MKPLPESVLSEYVRLHKLYYGGAEITLSGKSIDCSIYSLNWGRFQFMVNRDIMRKELRKMRRKCQV